MLRRLARNDGRKMARKDGRKIIHKDTEEGDCFAYWLAMTENRLARNDGKIIVIARSEASAERRSNLAKSLSDGRGGLPRRLARKDRGEGLLRLLARKDGKIIVVARSEASAERRSNLAKSLVTREGGIASPAGSQ